MKKILLFPTLYEIPESLRGLNKIKWGEIYKVSKHTLIALIGIEKKGQEVIKNIKNYYNSREFVFIVIGYGGALNKRLNIGDIVISNIFKAKNKREIKFSDSYNIIKKLKKNIKKIKILKGKNYTSNEIINDIKIKEKLSKKNYFVVNMEDYWIAQELRRENFYSIRVILDTFEERLPDLSDTISSKGNLSVIGSMFHIIKYPNHIKEMLYIKNKVKIANTTINNIWNIIKELD